MKLKYRLTAIISGMMTVIIAAISIILVVRARSLQEEAAYEIMGNMTGRYASDVGAYYQQFMDQAETLGNIMGGYRDIPEVNRRNFYLSMMHKTLETTNEAIAVYAVWKPNVLDTLNERHIGADGTDEAGNFIPRYLKDSGKISLTAHTDYLAVLDALSRTNTVDEPKRRVINGIDSFSVSFRSPIVDELSGELVGCVGVTVDIAFSAEIIDKIEPYGNGSAALYSYEGIVVAHQDRTRVGSDYREGVSAVGEQVIGQAIADGKERHYSANGMIVQISPFYIGDSETAWIIASSVPLETVMTQVDAITRFTVFLAIAVILFSGVIIFAIVTKVSSPIVKVSRTLKDIAEGEGDLTKQIFINSKDEIGDLAHFFNQTLEKIRALIITIKSQSVALSDIGTELSANMTETAAAVNQITANIQSIKGRVINQSASVTETNATMEQITVHINRLNGEIDNQRSSLSRSSSAVEQLLANIQSVTQTLGNNSKNVDRLTDASEVGRDGLRGVATDIQEISRESAGLMEINAVMENIASQTNLLSMNAAIEASHAGEAGKGFAVVADEIRKLAESSGIQSKTISAVLKKIKEAIDKITVSIEEVQKKFEAIDAEVKTVSDQAENIRGAMEEQNTGSQQILEAMGQLNNITQAVKGSSTEMLEGSNEVIQESKNLEAVTQEITNGMNEMANGADQINIAVSRVHEISGTNKESIDVLVREVARFKVE
ncbi:methyl-accepting chemotaxis protein [Leadbettera azotonutricia]|uniref:Methyl-accepting chemotaxis protein n=1 Tax=Leadbettera azotonutricia (strain ATCC BAA-888 / DSM 13862 / ZAS-9) TaxID=545695 RepID=F5Y8M4_LEAAZ|nr:methyl-accepting chemotaxis protein [Leadbettera azotonutricia]AEF81892.1 methyl-accepting chemotaxis protein [Leadbettera azotonutricia ZAS-9]